MTATVAVLILLILYMIYALDNPFGAGDLNLTRSSFDSTADQVGFLLDIELGAP